MSPSRLPRFRQNRPDAIAADRRRTRSRQLPRRLAAPPRPRLGGDLIPVPPAHPKENCHDLSHLPRGFAPQLLLAPSRSPMLATPAHAQSSFRSLELCAERADGGARCSRSTTRSPRSRTKRRCSSIRPAIRRACRSRAPAAPAVDVQRTQQLLSQAQNIAYDVQQIDKRSHQIRQRLAVGDDAAARRRRARPLAEHGRRPAGRHAVQAGVVGNIDTNRARCRRWSASQGRPARCRRRRRQPASRPSGAAAFRSHRRLAANGRADAGSAEQRRRRRAGPRTAPRFLTPGRLSSPATRRCSTTATEGLAMDGKMLARIGAWSSCDRHDGDRDRRRPRKRCGPAGCDRRPSSRGKAVPGSDEPSLRRCQSWARAAVFGQNGPGTTHSAG